MGMLQLYSLLACQKCDRYWSIYSDELDPLYNHNSKFLVAHRYIELFYFELIIVIVYSSAFAVPLPIEICHISWKISTNESVVNIYDLDLLPIRPIVVFTHIEVYSHFIMFEFCRWSMKEK